MPHPKRKTAKVLCVVLLAICLLFSAFTSRPRLGTRRRSANVMARSLDEIQNRTLGFEEVFVINLPTRTDNRDALALSASLTGVQLDWMDGVRGDAVSTKAMPFTESRRRKMSSSELGSWRAHVNALQRVVEQNLSSALILEGDADWDVRIKSHLHDFARASRALTQPLSMSPKDFADETFVSPDNTAQRLLDPLRLGSLPQTIDPTFSTYGDSWDVLHLGHCAQRVPQLAPAEDPKWAHIAQNIPKGHVLYPDDPSTAPSKFRHSYNDHDVLPFQRYPHYANDNGHTRIYHHSMDSLCSLAYAVTQRGARKLLLSAGVEAHEEQFDFMLRGFCDGDTEVSPSWLDNTADIRVGKDNTATGRNVCLTTQPPLFGQYKPKGANGRKGDISKSLIDFQWGNAKAARTDNIRWSTRLNLKKLVRGATDWIDQWPDKEE